MSLDLDDLKSAYLDGLGFQTLSFLIALIVITVNTTAPAMMINWPIKLDHNWALTISITWNTAF